jgi:CRISPR-associated protein Cas1
VDLYVKININDDLEELTPKIKQGIFNLLNCNVLSDGQVHTVSYGIERMVKSLSNCFINDGEKLVLPELMPLEQHLYE